MFTIEFGGVLMVNAQKVAEKSTTLLAAWQLTGPKLLAMSLYVYDVEKLV
jgi:hypothetical protein